jgi:predicted PurR-regulated permease PerM
MPSPQPRVVSVSTGTIIKTIAILIGIAVLWMIRDILLLLFSAMLLAGVIYPLSHWAARHRIPKGLAVGVFYVLMFGMVALAFALLIPALRDEATALLGSGPAYDAFKHFLGPVKTFSEQYGLVGGFPKDFSSIIDQVSRTFGGIFGTLTEVFGGIAGFLIVLVLAFYLIVEDQALKNVFRNIIPDRYHEFATNLVVQIIDKLGSWLRGQLVLGLIIGILYFIGLSFIQVPYPLLLALLGGLLEFIPYLGPFVAATPILFLAFSVSPTRALFALALIVIIQQLENNLIVPKVMQKAVGLNPIVSIVAFMIGAQLFGVIGAIFAIPVATAASVVIVEMTRFYREQK